MPNVTLEGLGVDEKDLRDFASSIKALQVECGLSMRRAMQRGTAELIKSLRARTYGTKTAPKYVDKTDIEKSEAKPKYLRKDDYFLRRMKMKRYGSKGPYFIEVYAWGGENSDKGKLRKYSVARIVKEVRSVHGKVRNWGLARKSWGWFMKALFGKNETAGDNPNTKVDDRMVEGSLVEKRGSGADGSFSIETPVIITIDIINKLHYIEEALYPGAVSRALTMAKKKIVGLIAKGKLDAEGKFRRGGH